jgi:hypothetical protein
VVAGKKGKTGKGGIPPFYADVFFLVKKFNKNVCQYEKAVKYRITAFSIYCLVIFTFSPKAFEARLTTDLGITTLVI